MLSILNNNFVYVHIYMNIIVAIILIKYTYLEELLIYSYNERPLYYKYIAEFPLIFSVYYNYTSVFSALFRSIL